MRGVSQAVPGYRGPRPYRRQAAVRHGRHGLPRAFRERAVRDAAEQEAVAGGDGGVQAVDALRPARRSGFGFPSLPSLGTAGMPGRSRGRVLFQAGTLHRLPGGVPVQLPELVQLHEFGVIIAEADIDAARKGAANRGVPRRLAGGFAAMPRDDDPRDRPIIAGRGAIQGSMVQIAHREIIVVGPQVHPHRIREEGRFRGMLHLRVFFVVILSLAVRVVQGAAVKPAVEGVAPVSEHVGGWPPGPGIGGGALEGDAVGRNWRVGHVGRRTEPHPIDGGGIRGQNREPNRLVFNALAVVGLVHRPGQDQLFEIAEALGLFGLELGSG